MSFPIASYSLASANAAAVIDDKWFGGVKPDYLNVLMAAIASTVGRQFGENADGWFTSSKNPILLSITQRQVNVLHWEISHHFMHIVAVNSLMI